MRRPLLIAALVAVQAGLVAASVGPQLVLRATGDPIDVAVVLESPWDGSSIGVDLAGLDAPWEHPDSFDETWGLPEGTVYVPLAESNGLWTATGHQRERPEGRHLTCDSNGWTLDCGFASFHSPTLADALPSPERMQATPGVASLRTDDDGDSVIVGLRLAD